MFWLGFFAGLFEGFFGRFLCGFCVVFLLFNFKKLELDYSTAAVLERRGERGMCPCKFTSRGNTFQQLKTQLHS